MKLNRFFAILVIFCVFWSVAYSTDNATWKKSTNKNGCVKEVYSLKIKDKTCYIFVLSNKSEIEVYALDDNFFDRKIRQKVLINFVNQTIKEHEYELIFVNGYSLYQDAYGYDIFSVYFLEHVKKLPRDLQKKFGNFWGIN